MDSLVNDLSSLAEMEHEDQEFIPEILPVDARLSIKGDVSKLISLFERAASVTPIKETILGTAFALLEAFPTSTSEVAYVRITASDGEQTVSVIVDGLSVLMGGAVLVPPKRILDILKLAPSTTAKLEILGNTAIIRSSRAQWTVQTPVGDSLNTIPDVESISLFPVPVDSFLAALTMARRAASTLSSRDSLMQLLIRGGTITGCDGGRLHRADLPGFPSSADLTIPIRVVDELAKSLRGTDSELFQMGYDDRILVFRIDQNSVIAQRLLLPFPSVETLLLGPAFSNQNSLTVNTKELSDVVKRMRINADPDYAGIFLSLQPGKKDAQGQLAWSLAVKTKDRQGNASQEVIECQWNGSGKPPEICLNHHYLSDFLAAYSGEFSSFKVGDDGKTHKSPLFLEDHTVGFTGIIQQMRADWLR